MENTNTVATIGTKWYVHPQDGGHTNSTIATARNGEGFMEKTMCADKTRRDLWKVDLEFVHQLVARKIINEVNFRVYMSHGDNRPQLFNLDWTKKKNTSPLVVLAHPIGDAVEENTAKMKIIFREVCLNPNLDVVPWFPFEILEALHSEALGDRQKGIYMCLSVIKKSSGLWLYGDRISAGMKDQAVLAIIQGIPVMAKSPGTKRDLAKLIGA